MSNIIEFPEERRIKLKLNTAKNMLKELYDSMQLCYTTIEKLEEKIAEEEHNYDLVFTQYVKARRHGKCRSLLISRVDKWRHSYKPRYRGDKLCEQTNRRSARTAETQWRGMITIAAGSINLAKVKEVIGGNVSNYTESETSYMVETYKETPTC